MIKSKNMNENFLEKKETKENLGLEQLPKVLDFLRSLGMEIAVRDIERAKEYLLDIGESLPLVRDGLDGIRAGYNKRKDILKIWFTNSFQNPDNEKRKIVEKWISDNFIVKKEFE